MVALVVCSTVLILAGVAAFVFRPRSIVRRRTKARLVVTLKSGASFEGVLFEADATAWVLRNARALRAAGDGADVPVDGEVLILVADVEYAQRPAL